MRHRTAGLGLGLLLFAVGCASGWRPGAEKAPAAKFPRTPTATELVAYMNKNAQLVQAVECEKVSLDVKGNGQSIGLEGLMACQKPRNFRLKAIAFGKSAADIGSNDQEFWFWISKAEPPHVYHCTYDALKTGNVELPFPFQPEMIMSALGIADYDPSKKYEVRPNGNTLELIEDAKSPSGQEIKKLTVFMRNEVPRGKPQVVAHVIRDARTNQDICVATIRGVTIDRVTGVPLPERVEIVWPGRERMELKMRFYDMHVVGIDKQRGERLFSRFPDLANHQGYDLALRQLDGPPGGITQTRGSEIGRPNPVPGPR